MIAFVILAGVTSIINPLFESTDELRHYRFVRIVATEHRLPVQGRESVRAQGHHPPLYYALSALLSGWVPSTHTGTYAHPENPFWGYRNYAVGVDNKLQYRHDPAERFPFRDGFLGAMIPRWVNVLLGAGTVALTLCLGRRVWPTAPHLALAAAALVALNPQFVYLSGAINNDILAALMGTAVLLLCITLVQTPPRDRRRPDLRTLTLLGVTLGLALLSKLHLAAMAPVVGLALGIAAFRPARVTPPGAGPDSAGRRLRASALRLRTWALGLALVGGLAGLLSGWWFARNLRLYGDLTGMSRLNEMWGGRDAAGNVWALRQGLPYLWASLWGRFGYGQIPLPATMTTLMLGLCAVGLLGLLAARRRRIPPAVLAILGLAVVLFVGVVSYYILVQPAGPMGRFLFPVLPAFAILVVGGLDAWLGARHARRLALGVVGGMAVFALVALGGYLWPAVRPPRAVAPAPVGAAPVAFGDVAQVLSAALVTGEDVPAVAPGDAVFVRVTWRPLRWTDRPYAVFVHLVDEAGVLVAQRDTWPGLGRTPTTSWQTGAAFEDVYRVDLPATLYSPNELEVRVGLYEPTYGRLPVLRDGTAAAGTAADSLAVGRVRVPAPAGPWPNPLDADFGGEVALVGYELDRRVVAPGETVALTLVWRPDPTLSQDVSKDYSVFAQVLDAAWHVWGSHDGGNPGWTAAGPDGTVTETRYLTLIPETPPGSYPIQVGLFTGAGRVPLVAPDGRHLGDHVSLGPIRVVE